MKKIGFIFSCITILIGVIVIIQTSILNKIMPKIGRAAFQSVAVGSFTPDWYTMDFSFANTFSIIIIIVGVCFAGYFWIHENKN